MALKQVANNAIVELIQSEDFKKCISKIKPEHLQSDLASEVYLVLLETKPEKIIQLWERNELRFYAVRIIFNMACSNTSPFYKKYRSYNAGYGENYYNDNNDIYNTEPDESGKQNYKSREDYYNEINLDNLFDESEVKDRKKLELVVFSLIEDWSRSIHNDLWYKGTLLKLYIKYGDYRTVGKETKIPFTSIFSTIKQAIEEVKQFMKAKDIPDDREIDEMLIKLLNDFN